MREASYTDDEGRQWAVHLPDGVPDSDAEMGIPLGPPSLAPLGLPLEFEVKLHNQLFGRRLLTFRDVKARRMDILGALQAALKVDIVAIAHLYADQKPDEVPAQPEKTRGVRGDGINRPQPEKTPAPKRGQRRRKRR